MVSGTWVPGAFVSNVTVGGHTWNRDVGSNGAYSYLYQLQFGWEIVSTTATASSSATASTLTWKTTNFTATAK